MVKKITVVMLLIFLLGVGASSAYCATEKLPTYKWRMGHTKPIDHPLHEAACLLVERVKADSNGRIIIDVFPANALGDYTIVQERVGLGAIEMNFACISSERDKRLQIAALPWVAKTWDDVPKIYGTGGFVSQRIGEFFADQNIKDLGVWLSHFGGMSLKHLPPEPANPDVPKNCKVRVPPMKVYELTAEMLGYSATSLPFVESISALQTGVIDGVFGAGADSAWGYFRDIIGCYVNYHDHFEDYHVYMNAELWASLSKEDQKIILDACAEVERLRALQGERDEEEWLEKLKNHGIEVVCLTNEELNKLAQKARTEIWPQMEKDIGKEVIDELLAELTRLGL